jgi:sacsin
VKRALQDPNYSFDLSFQASIEHKTSAESKKTLFVVHHSINGGSMDGSLRDWAKTQNLLPWVAVAAPVPVSCDSRTPMVRFLLIYL